VAVTAFSASTPLLSSSSHLPFSSSLNPTLSPLSSLPRHHYPRSVGPTFSSLLLLRSSSSPTSTTSETTDKSDKDTYKNNNNDNNKDTDKNTYNNNKDKDKNDKHKHKDKDNGTNSVDANGFMYTADADFSMTDQDFVLVGTKTNDIYSDPTLNLLSSELAIRRHLSKQTESTSSLSELPLDLVWERSLDTIEDIAVHLKRVPYKWGFAPTFHQTIHGVDARETVVILGSGWAAHAFMKVADCSKLRIITISPTNHFVFTPMLASAAVGTVEYRSMTEAVRSANPLIDNYIEGKAIDVNVRDKTVTVRLNPLLECTGVECDVQPEIIVSYDRLVVSVGAKVADSNVPGAHRCLRLKSCDDARNVRTALGECLEYASRPDVLTSTDPTLIAERKRRVTFVIVGGGPTGVELAGELSDFARDVTRPRLGAFSKLANDVRVVLVHGGSDLLPQFDEALRKEAYQSLSKRGIDVRLNTYVTNVGDNNVTLSTKVIDPTTYQYTGERIEEVLPSGLTVWCAGTAPVPFVTRLLDQLPPEAKSDYGMVKVDGWLRPPMPTNDLRGSVYVLGDAADFNAGSSSSSSSSSSSLPQTAQVAGQQGAYAARLLSRGYNLSADRPILPCADRTNYYSSSSSSFSFPFYDHSTHSTCTVTDIPEQRQQLDERTSDDEALIHGWLRLRGLETSPQFRFFNLGLLAYLGGGEALSQVQLGDVSVFKWAGSVAFVLWRSVYLVKQVATKNRVLVTFDWIKSALFGRDVTRL